MSVAFKAMATDVLSDVLATLRLRGHVFCVTDMSSPWAMRLPAGSTAHFHVIVRGVAWLRLPRDRVPVRLQTGDLVVLPHGSGHVLSDGSETTPLLLTDLLARRPAHEHVLRHGGTGAQTHMICGAFEFENRGDNPILPLLPRVIHVRARDEHADGWLMPTLGLLADEARASRHGSGVLITRLTEILFVQSLRLWMSGQPAGHGGWLGALRDRHIASALALMHRTPQRPWTVAQLAREVGMSRSPFAARFRALVGVSPLAYLHRWRMHLANTLLTQERLSVSAAAERVGYDSDAAFSKAFKRRFGSSPGAVRRRAVQTATTPA